MAVGPVTSPGACRRAALRAALDGAKTGGSAWATKLEAAQRKAGRRPARRTLRSLAKTAPFWLFRSSLTWGQDNPDADQVKPGRRVVAVAPRRTAGDREELPTAAAEHPLRA